MNENSVALTDSEFKELAASLNVQSHLGVDSAEDAEELLRDHYSVKFPDYITDGPGYSGEAFVFLWGIPVSTVFTRDKRNGDFYVNDN